MFQLHSIAVDWHQHKVGFSQLMKIYYYKLCILPVFTCKFREDTPWKHHCFTELRAKFVKVKLFTFQDVLLLKIIQYKANQKSQFCKKIIKRMTFTTRRINLVSIWKIICSLAFFVCYFLLTWMIGIKTSESSRILGRWQSHECRLWADHNTDRQLWCRRPGRYTS